jgi:anti-sigma factor RsiW
VDPHEVTGYLEGTIPPVERARIEAHLADCEECAAELAEVSRLRRAGTRPVTWMGVGAAAAAVIAVVMVGRPHERRTGDEGSFERGVPTAPAVNAVAPGDGAVLSSEPQFVWDAVPGAATYRILVTRLDGDSVWASSLRDTVVRAPDSALTPGAYYWFVDALLSDGRSIPGKAREFRLGP